MQLNQYVIGIGMGIALFHITIICELIKGRGSSYGSYVIRSHALGDIKAIDARVIYEYKIPIWLVINVIRTRDI